MQNNTFSTLFVGQNLIKLKEVDSTNNFLKNLASNSGPLPEGTVIMAENQFAGRGQQENIWQSEAGKNISMSIYLRPSFLALKQQFYLNMAVSLAVRAALSVFLPSEAEVKWPNDIYYGAQKLGGILIENVLTGSSIKSSVAGIGLNINQQSFSEPLKDKAISVFQILHSDVSLESVMEKIFVYMEKYYLNLKTGKVDLLKREYLQNLYKFGIPSLYKAGGHIFEGKIEDVEESGRLIVQAEGELKYFSMKEIEFLHYK